MGATFIISELYEKNKEEILDCILNFEIRGNLIYSDRNKVKTFKLKDGMIINIKSFKVPYTINKFIYQYFRKSKAERSYIFGRKLIEKGILTPEPIGYYIKHYLCGIKESFYVSLHLDHDLDFRKLTFERDYPDRKLILEKFGEFTFDLHEKGIYFIDHSPGNTLIVSKKDKEYKYYLIDLNRMKFNVTFDLKLRVKNLSKLATTWDVVKPMSDSYAKKLRYNPEKFCKLVMDETNKFQHKYYLKKERKIKIKRMVGKNKNPL